MRPPVEAGYARRAVAEIAKLREAGISDGTWPRHAVPPERLAEWEAAKARRDEARATAAPGRSLTTVLPLAKRAERFDGTP